ncbi:MAG: hypothetical protein KDD39_07320 [Bdellovibrionales bacterium]|nr:hypothetical protein [Bdellovibrionales bacterium]
MKNLSLAIVGMCTWFALAAQAAPGVKEIEAQVENLKKEAVFQDLLKTLSLETKKSALASQKLKPQARKQLVLQLKKLAGTVAATQQVPKEVPQGLRPYLPMQKTTMLKIMKGVQFIKERYPLVTQTAQFGQAASLFFFTSEYDLIDIDPNHCDTVNCDCHRECSEEYRNAYNAAIDEWMQENRENFTPWGLINNYINHVQEVNRLQEELADCRARCNGWGENWECQDHEDCEPGEYCRKPFGNPVNTCSPGKPNGWACSSDVKCASGCCKYHFPTNPFQMVCRPSDKCD